MRELKNAHYDFDVALSFAGEDRGFVRQIATELKSDNIRVFFDEDNAATMWGEDLYTYLDDVYRRRSRFVVIVVSAHYAAKPWTNHERKSAQARALLERSAYVLPVRLDDTELDGLRPTVAFLDARVSGVGGIVRALKEKIAGDSSSVIAEPLFDGKVPRNADALRTLLRTKPAAWEYLLYGGLLWQRFDSLEDKFRDTMLRFAPLSSNLQKSQERAFVDAKLNELTYLVASVNRVLDATAWERAFGRPGTPGDEDMITHLAHRLADIYEQLLDWSRSVRGASRAGLYDEVLELLAQMADQPVREMREFVHELIAEFDQLTHRIRAGEVVHIRRTLTITLHTETAESFVQALKKMY